MRFPLPALLSAITFAIGYLSALTLHTAVDVSPDCPSIPSPRCPAQLPTIIRVPDGRLVENGTRSYPADWSLSEAMQSATKLNKRVRERLYLFVMLDAGNPVMALHVLRHYLHLGVAPQNFLLMILAHPAAPSEIEAQHQLQAMLEHHGLHRVWSIVEEWDDGAAVHLRLSMMIHYNLAEFSQWVIPADMDELVEFGEPLDSLIQRLETKDIDYVSAEWIDRVTPSGVLAPVPADPNALWDIFSFECPQFYERFARNKPDKPLRKVVLHRGWVRTAPGNHYPTTFEKCRIGEFFPSHNIPRSNQPCLGLLPTVYAPSMTQDELERIQRRRLVVKEQEAGRVHHFKWTAGVIERMQERFRVTSRARVSNAKDFSLMADYLVQHGRRVPVESLHCVQGYSPAP